eukprot:1161944-Pelagomonas_calceolata.AAC.24
MLRRKAQPKQMLRASVAWSRNDWIYFLLFRAKRLGAGMCKFKVFLSHQIKREQRASPKQPLEAKNSHHVMIMQYLRVESPCLPQMMQVCNNFNVAVLNLCC